MSVEIVTKAKEMIESILDEKKINYRTDLQDGNDDGKNSSCFFYVEPDQLGCVAWDLKKKKFIFLFRNNHTINYMAKEGFDEEYIHNHGAIWIEPKSFEEFTYFLVTPLVKK